jgi:hypothetical protein
MEAQVIAWKIVSSKSNCPALTDLFLIELAAETEALPCSNSMDPTLSRFQAARTFDQLNDVLKYISDGCVPTTRQFINNALGAACVRALSEAKEKCNSGGICICAVYSRELAAYQQLNPKPRSDAVEAELGKDLAEKLQQINRAYTALAEQEGKSSIWTLLQPIGLENAEVDVDVEDPVLRKEPQWCRGAIANQLASLKAAAEADSDTEDSDSDSGDAENPEGAKPFHVGNGDADSDSGDAENPDGDVVQVKPFHIGN